MEKKRSFGGAFGISWQYFLCMNVANGSFNSQMVRTLVKAHKASASCEGFVCARHLSHVQDVG